MSSGPPCRVHEPWCDALLPPEIVTRIAAFELPEQSEEGYRIPLALKLRDEIAPYNQIATAHWERFSTLRQGSANASQQFVLEVHKPEYVPKASQHLWPDRELVVGRMARTNTWVLAGGTLVCLGLAEPLASGAHGPSRAAVLECEAAQAPEPESRELLLWFCPT